jgi:glycerol-3-phosphate dehydrogenase (NAD(P)+)
MTKIAVLGAGSWGTALSLLLARNGHQIYLWGHDPEFQKRLHLERENLKYLPGFSFPKNIQPVQQLTSALSQADEVLLAIPSRGFRALLENRNRDLAQFSHLTWATKGFDPKSHGLLSDLVTEIMGADMGCLVLSGPSFALEVAAQQPTAVTLACPDLDLAEKVAALYRNDQFRVYTNQDLIGVQVGGALKNVLAVAVGIAMGLGLGANAKAALITRGLAEISRLGQCLGGRAETMMGLAGAGDLILTCGDLQSRNLRFGLSIGQGARVNQAMESVKQVVEGYEATAIAYQISQLRQIEMPIVAQTYQILYTGLSPHTAVNNLLQRDPKPESH